MIAASKNTSSVKGTGDKSDIISKPSCKSKPSSCNDKNKYYNGYSLRFISLPFNYMDNSNGDSGANTILIVVILMILVGFAVWWFTSTQTGSAIQKNAEINVDLKLPTGG